jgi:precorrin-8X/cobalt-precorrin-8 methylmutase
LRAEIMSDTPAYSGPVIVEPAQIEAESFRIIDVEVGAHGFDAGQWPVVRRVVHTTADFDFIRQTSFSAGAVPAALAALRHGPQVYCDTRMVMAGVNRARLTALGGSICCHVDDPVIAKAAAAEGVTRSTLALRRAVAEGCTIYLIGNAPTALFELVRLAAAGEVNPALVVGVPVGFVGAVEAKEALRQSDLPHIVCSGRKGGSPVAAAIMNALLILAGA